MKILHVVTDRDRRGAQVFAVDLAAGLDALGHKNTVVALASGRHSDDLPLETLGRSRRSWRTLRTLRSRARNVDVVVAHGSATLLACALALTGSKTPFVYRQISDPLHWAATPLRRLRVAVYLRRSVAIVALSDGAADVLQQHYRLRSDKIVVIPNAVPDEDFHRADDVSRVALRRRLQLEDRVVALYLGALVPEKGVDIAIRSVAALDGVHLVVAGDGPSRADLERLAETAAPERVSFLGNVSEPRDVLAVADVLVLPSRAGDSMPAVVIEAGLMGLPSVTTPVGSIADVVVDGKTGLVVPIGDEAAFQRALAGLVHDEARRRQLGSAARERCLGSFTIASTAPRWQQLLGDVGRHRRRTT